MSGEHSHGYKPGLAELIATLGTVATIVSLALDHLIVAIPFIVIVFAALCMRFRAAGRGLVERLWPCTPPPPPEATVKAVFIYGSLLDLKDLGRTISREVFKRDYVPARLKGYEKAWSVASIRLNMVTPDWRPVRNTKFVWLSIRQRAGAACAGAVVDVTEDEFKAICSRERSYRAVDVTAGIQTPAGQPWTYKHPVFSFVGLSEYADVKDALLRQDYAAKLRAGSLLHGLELDLPAEQPATIDCLDPDVWLAERSSKTAQEQVAVRDAELLKHLDFRGRMRTVNRDRKVIPTLARPVILSGTLYSRVCYVAEQAVRLVSQTLDHVLDHPEVAMRDYSFTKQEIAYAGIEKGIPSAHIPQIARVDFTVARDTVQILEVNCDSPAGMAHLDDLIDWYSTHIPAWTGEDCRPIFPERSNAICRALLEAFLARFEDFSRKKGARPAGIAIVERELEEKPAYTEFLQFCKLMKDEYRIPAVICEPKDLTFSNGELVHVSKKREKTKVELIYKRILWKDLLREDANADGILKAYSKRKVCICNSLRSRLAGNKLFFPLYGDKAQPFWCERKKHPTWKDLDRDVLMAHLPETHVLTEGARDRVERNPENFTVKPARSYQSAGVLCGPDWERDKGNWREAIEAALALGDHVFQRYCHHGHVSSRQLEPVKGIPHDVPRNWPFIVGAYVINGRCMGLEAKVGPKLPVALREMQGGHRTAVLTPGPVVESPDLTISTEEPAASSVLYRLRQGSIERPTP